MMKKVFNWIKSLELGIVVIIIFFNNMPSVFGIKPFVVESGSMKPEISTGDMAYINTRCTYDDVDIGDIIAFRVNNETVVTHRVIDIDNERKTFTTKGDANENADFSPVPFDCLVGKTIYSMPVFGTVMIYLSSIKVKIVLIGIFISQYLLERIIISDNAEKVHAY